MTEGDWDRVLYESTGWMQDETLMGSVPFVRVMRGQVVVRELEVRSSSVIWTPDSGPRQIKTHRGVVLAMGKPALMPIRFDGERWVGGAEVPWGFTLGDTIQFHFEHHQEAWTMPWPRDGMPATWLAQHNVDGVWTP